VKQTLAQTQGNCQQASVRWKHASGVVLPVAAWGNLRKPFPRANTRWTFATGAAEQADFRAGIFKAGPSKAVLGRRLANGWPRPTLLAKGVIKAQRRLVYFPPRRLKPGSYVFAIRMTASMNPKRSTVLVSHSFRVRSARRR
jgi:hypothetical protein